MKKKTKSQLKSVSKDIISKYYFSHAEFVGSKCLKKPVSVCMIND